jgi:uncharacterized membrane protein YqjE
MNTPIDAGPVPKLGAATVAPTGWIDAALTLLSSRLQLAQLESKRAARQLVKVIIFVVVAAVCAFFGYALLIAGVVTLIADKVDWSWGAVALCAALLHMIVAVVLIKLAKPAPGDAFVHTRAEFKKDCEWLKNFQKNKKSKI